MLARLRVFFSRLVASLSSPRTEPGFDEELEAHLALLTDRFMAQGLKREEAIYAARRQFGGIGQLKQRRHEERGFFVIEEFLRDTRHAVRTLVRTPAFTTTALAALALGIGANTAIFSLVNAVSLKPLKAPDADRIVRFLEVYGQTSTSVAGFPQFNLWRQQTTLFEDVSAHRMDVVNLTGGSYPEQIPLARVSESFFHLFGAPILYGRTFTPDEDQPGGAHVAVLSHELWRRRFGSDPNAVGRFIVLGAESYTVIGVLAPAFDTEQFDSIPAAWVPAQVDPNTAERGSYCTVTGRLKPGVTLTAANAQLQSLAEEYRGMLTSGAPGPTFIVQKLQDAMGADLRSSFLLLAGAVSFVLLIASANVANLLLVRATGRKREIAIRAAVGAGRGRIIRQLLAESITLSLAGGVAGLVLGVVGIRAILSLNPIPIPRIGPHGAGIGFDWRVVAFTVFVSLVTGVLFGLVPALGASRTDLTAALKENTSRFGGGRRQNRIRSVLTVSEVALALVLLMGAALLIRSYVALRLIQPGFETHNVLTTQMSLSATRFEKTSDLDRLVREGIRSIRSLPGVETAGAACCVPLETVWQLSFVVEGRPLDEQFHGFAGWTFVSPEYFDAFRIPVLKGRAFTERDREGAPGVVIINQAMANRFWPNGDPLNDRLTIGRYVRPEYAHDAPRQIVGIVGDVRDTGLGNIPRPGMYVPIAQLPDEVNAINLRLLPVAWFVRVRAAGPSLGTAIQNELRQASGGLPTTETRWMDQVSTQSVARTQFSTLLMTIFGGSALLLAVIGIYGLMAYTVQQRTQEIGIRIALGARYAQIRKMVVLQGMQLVLLGVGIGIAAAFGLTRLLAGFLYGVQAHDVLVFLTVPVVLSLVALLAVWIPARRASSVDPIKALRCD